MGFDVIQRDLQDPHHSVERHHEFVADPSLPHLTYHRDDDHLHTHSHHDHPHVHSHDKEAKHGLDHEVLRKYGIDLDDLHSKLHGHSDDHHDPLEQTSLDALHQYISKKTADLHDKDRG